MLMYRALCGAQSCTAIGNNLVPAVVGGYMHVGK